MNIPFDARDHLVTRGGGVYPFHDRSGGLRERRTTWKRSSLSWAWTEQLDLL